MSDTDWHQQYARAVMVFLNGEGIAEPNMRGERVVDDSFLLIFNADADPVTFTLPPVEFGEQWACVLDTDHTLGRDDELPAGGQVEVSGRSTLVLTRPAGES